MNPPLTSMTINNITISSASSTPNRSIIPGPPTPSLPNPPTNGEDRITISADGGSEAIIGYTVNSAGGEDTVRFNGSPERALIDLGSGNDLFEIDTVDLGGSMTLSSLFGRDGNDVFRILVGDDVNTSFLDGGFGSDLFELEGSFNLVTITGGGNNDVIRFLNPGQDGESNFSSSFVGLGAGDDLFEDGGFPLTAFASSINGGGGSDTISLYSSTADTGSDGVSITGGNGNDFLYGVGEDGESTVRGGSGADFIQTFDGDDLLVGGGGSDTLLLGSGSDFADAGEDNDVVWGQDGQNTIRAGLGSDIVVGGIGDDDIKGGEGTEPDRDYLVGDGGDDTIDGASGNDLIYGDGITAANAGDFAYGQFTLLGRNVVTGDEVVGITDNKITLAQLTGYFRNGDFLGNATWSISDLFASRLANKTSTAPATSPWLNGTTTENGAILADNPGGLLLELDDEQRLANNLRVPSSPELVRPLNNGNGDDELIGNSGNDTIFGGGGDDEISGGLGADVIIGGTGEDEMSGGDNADIFVQGNGSSVGARTASRGTNWTFDWDNNAPDIITDFEATTNDGSVIDRIAFSNGTANSFALANTESLVIRDFLGSANGQWGNNEVVLFRGTWSGPTGRFTTSNDGDDALVFKSNTFSSGSWGPNPVPNPMGNQAVVLLGAGGEDFDGGNFYGNFGI